MKLRFYGKDRYYLYYLPLHHSQHQIGCDENYVDLELYIRPTYDFCSELLSFGNQVKVLEPQSLGDKLCQIMADALNRYGHKVNLNEEKSEE